MLQMPRPNVLLLIENPNSQSRWSDRLRRASINYWHTPAEIAPQQQIDVILSDCPSSAALGQSLGLNTSTDGVGQLPFGVLGTGPAVWADACLSDDCSDGELTIALELLGTIGRLRRQYADSLREGALARTLAETDPLTGLANRRVWDARLSELAARSQLQTDLCLAIVDLDKFKAINDQHGYAAGDEVLKAAASALAGAVRRHDLVARIGGDEFGVLLSHIAEANCPSALARLLRGVAKVAVPSGGDLSASIGYTVPDPSGMTKIAELLASAETAVRKAKGLGGATVVRG